MLKEFVMLQGRLLRLLRLFRRPPFGPFDPKLNCGNGNWLDSEVTSLSLPVSLSVSDAANWLEKGVPTKLKFAKK